MPRQKQLHIGVLSFHTDNDGTKRVEQEKKPQNYDGQPSSENPGDSKHPTVGHNSLLLDKTNNSSHIEDLRTVFALYTNLRIAVPMVTLILISGCYGYL